MFIWPKVFDALENFTIFPKLGFGRLLKNLKFKPLSSCNIPRFQGIDKKRHKLEIFSLILSKMAASQSWPVV